MAETSAFFSTNIKGDANYCKKKQLKQIELVHANELNL